MCLRECVVCERVGISLFVCRMYICEFSIFVSKITFESFSQRHQQSKRYKEKSAFGAMKSNAVSYLKKFIAHCVCF